MKCTNRIMISFQRPIFYQPDIAILHRVWDESAHKKWILKPVRPCMSLCITLNILLLYTACLSQRHWCQSDPQMEPNPQEETSYCTKVSMPSLVLSCRFCCNPIATHLPLSLLFKYPIVGLLSHKSMLILQFVNFKKCCCCSILAIAWITVVYCTYVC